MNDFHIIPMVKMDIRKKRYIHSDTMSTWTTTVILF